MRSEGRQAGAHRLIGHSGQSVLYSRKLLSHIEQESNMK